MLKRTNRAMYCKSMCIKTGAGALRTVPVYASAALTEEYRYLPLALYFMGKAFTSYHHLKPQADSPRKSIGPTTSGTQ